MKQLKPVNHEKRSLIFYTLTFLLFSYTESFLFSIFPVHRIVYILNAYLLLVLLAGLFYKFYRYFKFRNFFLRYFFGILFISMVIIGILSMLNLLFPFLIPFQIFNLNS